jgi:hypothetical protein
MAGTIEQINKLTDERARLYREASNGHRGDPETIARIKALTGELQRLWDKRRAELGSRSRGVDRLIDSEYERIYGREEAPRELSWKELAELAEVAA